MPLDPSIIMRGTELQMAQAAQRDAQIANFFDKLTARREKAEAEKKKLESDYEGSAYRVAQALSTGKTPDPDDLARAKAWDAIRRTENAIDPVTGNMYQKDRSIFDVVSGGNQGIEYPAIDVTDQILGGAGASTPFVPPQSMSSSVPQELPNVFDNLTEPTNYGDEELLPQVKAPLPTGNRKLDQSMLEKSAGANIDIQKKRIEDKTSPLNESQGKAATFADRMMQANEVFENPDVVKAQQSWKNRAISEVPIFSASAEKKFTTGDYKKATQAERNFINAVLRRESGAVISQQEFDNAREQYFPQPEDPEDVLEQKRQNRQTVIEGFIRDAGPAYSPKQNMRDKYKKINPAGISHPDPAKNQRLEELRRKQQEGTLQ